VRHGGAEIVGQALRLSVRERQPMRSPYNSLSTRGTCPADFGVVDTAKTSLRKIESDPDIFFHCQHCKAALVANKSAAGMNLACQKCGQQTLVPQPEEPDANARVYAEELRGKLKENESQRAEVTGHINQLTIQLHRWQLRLQMLNERKAQLEKDLGGK
jgi:DNA-directed RNA polymerase subunit M/transcription elongation factor TFIIS